MIRLTIRLLGSFHVTLDGEPVTGFQSNKVRALLACLAMEAHQAHSRETLAGLLWPDQPDQVARHNLRQALSNLRRALGDRDAGSPFLCITPGTVQFNPNGDYWLDASRFEALVASSEAHSHHRIETCRSCIRDLEETVALYRGEFLEGLYVGDSVAFEEWALLRRERFHRLVLDNLYHLANYNERRHQYDRARRYARRQVELEPWREEAHRQLMRLLSRSGQRSAALAQYEQCRRSLAEELGIEPDGETQALYERIRAARSAPPHNLPTQPTPFFGRREDLAEIAERLGNPECRLLTLVGPGGIGKTRLALAAATEQVGAFFNGIFFVPLAAVSSTHFLTVTIAEAIGLVFSSEQDPQAQLLDYLRGKEMLLVMDSFEHLLPSAHTGPLEPGSQLRTGPVTFEAAGDRDEGDKEGVELLLAMLTQAPHVKILATSREPLRLRAEWLFEVRGLALPEPEATVGLEAYSALQLFVETARRVDAGFGLAGDVAQSALRICRLVGGMPLGIEMAAAAVQAWSCDQIADQIQRNLDFLTTSMHDVPVRHCSMRAVFDHSWRLLTEKEQKVTARLSVFRSPLHPEAAWAVAGAGQDVLAALATRSILSRNRAGQYQMHQLLKQYAAQKLAQTSHCPEETWALHCRYYAWFLHERQEALKGSQQRETIAEIATVIDDVRVAWRWAVTHRDREALDLALQSLYNFYWARNWFQESAETFEQAAASVQASGEDDRLLLARLWTRLAEFYAWLGHYDPAQALLGESIDICRAHQARWDLALALAIKGQLDLWQGDYAASSECNQESLDIFREVGDRYWTAHCLNSLAVLICEETADLERARPLYEESLAIAREIGDQIGEAKVLVNLGGSAHEQGDYVEAQRLYRESLALYRALDYRRGTSAVLNNLGQVARVLGDHVSAKELIHESLDIKRETGNRNTTVSSLMELGNVTCRVGEYEESLRWYRQALALAWEIQAFHMARYVIVGIAELLIEQGYRQHALDLLYFVQHQPVGEQDLLNQVNRAATRLETALAPDVVARCRARGRVMTLEAVVMDFLSEKSTKHQF